jgi:hypothetical protein
MTGTAVKSSVLRVNRSKVRIPRSHKTTWSFPSDRMYSADINHFDSPRQGTVSDSPTHQATQILHVAGRFGPHPHLTIRSAGLGGVFGVNA